MPFYVLAAAMMLISIMLLGYWFTWTIFCILEIDPATERSALQED